MERTNNASRRQALLCFAAASLSGFTPLGGLLAQTTLPIDTLDAFVDVLLPADDLSPSASAVGVGRSIADLAANLPLLAQLIDHVSEWLDSSGAGRFVDLSREDRETLVAFMEKADIDTLEGRFFQLVRLFAIEFYYARDDVLAGLALDPAPQPSGYPPPWI